MRILRSLLLATLLPQALNAQPDDFCGRGLDEERGFRSPLAVAPPSIRMLDRLAVVLEYPSIFDVHSRPTSSEVPLRSQQGSFDTQAILGHLEAAVNPADYDFVLLFSLRELPGWIHSGLRIEVGPARNIGLGNALFGQRNNPRWTRLRAAPHMNSADFIFSSQTQGALTAIHEIGHHWSSFWNHAQPAVGPREWRPGMPVAWLAGCCAHWSFNWTRPEGPGIMYSGPTNPRFNELDLYAMGLMSYEEARAVTHSVYECSPPDYNLCRKGATHEFNLDDLIQSNSIGGATYFTGDGKRFPAEDASLRSLRVLVAVVKEAGETLTPAQEAAIRKLIADLPAAWSTATLGRSTMAVGIPYVAVPCTPGPTTLCVSDTPGDGRFEVKIAFSTSQSGGRSGEGRAVPLSSLGVNRGGLFSFFEADNPEMLVKILNVCGFNGFYWVFASAGTNVGYELTITDTKTGLVRRYSNEDLNPAEPIQDTAAIPCQ